MKKLLLVLMLLTAMPAHAQPVKMSLGYTAYWSGMKVGEMKVYINEDAKSNYTYRVKLNSKGVAQWASKYSSENVSTGAGKKPKKYTTEWSRKKEKQKIEIAYAGDKVTETATPPEKRPKRPEVSAEEKNGRPDPIVTALIARDKISELVKAGKTKDKFTLKFFDGRRSTNMNFELKDYVSREINGEKMKLLQVRFKREAIAGFSKKELGRMEKEEPVVDAYLNKYFIPLLMIGKSGNGTVTAKLTAYCNNDPKCAI